MEKLAVVQSNDDTSLAYEVDCVGEEKERGIKEPMALGQRLINNYFRLRFQTALARL